MSAELLIDRRGDALTYRVQDDGVELAHGTVDGIGGALAHIVHTVRPPVRPGEPAPTVLSIRHRTEQTLADTDAAVAAILRICAEKGPVMGETPRVVLATLEGSATPDPSAMAAEAPVPDNCTVPRSPIVSEDLPDLRRAAGVLFDLDGVLTPTAEVHMRAWQAVFDEVLTRWGVTEPYTDADYFAYVDGKKRYDGVASLLRSRNIEIPWGEVTDPPEAETICGVGNRKNAAFAAALRSEGIAPYPGSLALLEQLRAAEVPMGVVSSSKNAAEVLASAGIRDFFRIVVDGVVAEHEHLASKPAPDMFREGARMLGVDPSEAIAVEDAVSGVASAASAGYATVVGVDRGAGADALREAGATCIVDDLARLLSGPELGRDPR